MTSLNGGVLIIGSLLWDDAQLRKEWRQSSLDLSGKQSVAAPIRYGRISESRHLTYTMVFSSSVPDHGIAQAVPFRNSIKSFAELESQVQSLARAEKLKKKVTNPYFWKWGCVGILLNPVADSKAELLTSILENWPKKFGGFNNVDFCVNSEQRSIDKQGMLQIGWPTGLSWDFLLATVVKPEVSDNVYPDADGIVAAMNNAACYNYFLNNKQHGISTFQDEDISARLKSTKKLEFLERRACA
ncbi:MAG: hypothetical protein HY961_16630, partial [Ignavibacteriae bacterium]|nr:hypothetical protein [Ignavibacteriota bacterium]